MLSKLFDTLGIVAIATLLGVGGFGGYLYGTGKLNAARVNTMARVLRGELDQPPPATQPARHEMLPIGAATTAPACTEEEVRQLRQRQHLESLQAARAARDLEAQRRLLDQVLHDVVQEQEKLDARRQAADKERTAAEDASAARKKKAAGDPAEDAGFQKELALVSGMQARQAKEHVLRVWKKQPAEAVRLIREMDESKAKRIFEQFKTPEELQVQSELLEQIRLPGNENQAHASGKTNGAATP